MLNLRLLIWMLFLLFLAGCSGQTADVSTAIPAQTASTPMREQAVSETSPLPTATSVPTLPPTEPPIATVTVEETAVPPTATQPTNLTNGEGWQAFEIATIKETHGERNQSYYRFLDKASVSMGLYVLSVGATDNQTPHGDDEVYYILEGAAILQAGEDDIEVAAGSIVYIKAFVPHKFHTITEELRTLVLFSQTISNENDPDWLAFTVDEVLAARNAGENVWNQFLDVSTMQFGMYMLPQSLGGDSSLTHTFDEVNLVVNGRSTFSVGADEIPVQPGSIIYVEDGVSHQFQDLSEDFDVLILFEVRQ